MQIHHIRSAGDRGERQRTGNALAEARQVRHNTVVLETPQRATPAEARLYFVANQQHLVPGAPLPERLHVFPRRKGRATALISLENDSRNVLRLEPFLPQPPLEEFE